MIQALHPCTRSVSVGAINVWLTIIMMAAELAEASAAHGSQQSVPGGNLLLGNTEQTGRISNGHVSALCNAASPARGNGIVMFQLPPAAVAITGEPLTFWFSQPRSI